MEKGGTHHLQHPREKNSLLTTRIFFGLATLQKLTAVVIKCMPFGDLSGCEPGTSQDSQRIPRLAQVRFTASGLEVKLCGVTS